MSANDDLLALAEEQLRYWSDKVAFLKQMTMPQVLPAPDTTAPTTPGSFAVTTANPPVATWTASSDVNGVDHYLLERKLTAGSTYSTIASTALLTATDSTAAISTGYTYRLSAFDPAGNQSAYATAVITTPGTPSTDVTAPPVPAQPNAATSVTTTSYTITGALSVDAGAGVVSGTLRYPLYKDAVYTDYVYHPSVGTRALYQIGSASGGTDNGSTIVGGGSGHYGTSDTGFTYNAGACTGDFTLTATIAAFTSSAYYDKVGIEIRESADPSAVYLNIFRQPSNGQNQVSVEWRDTAGTSSQQLASGVTIDGTALTITKVGTTLTAKQGSTILKTLTMANMPNACLAGDFSVSASAGYSSFALTAATVWTYLGTGTPGQVQSITVKAEDYAGNISAASTGRTVTLSSASAQQYPGYFGYLIGGNGYRYDNSTYQTWAALLDFHVMAWSNGWDFGSTQSMSTIMGNITAASTTSVKQLLYGDPWATIYHPTQLQSAESTYNWKVRESYPSGTVVSVDGSNYGNFFAGGPTDPAGRTYQDAYVAYMLDYQTEGGAGGLTGASVANTNGNGHYFDDVQPYTTPGGDWRRDGSYDSGYDAQFRGSYIQLAAKFKAIKGSNFLIGMNLSALCNSTAVITEFVGQVDIGVLENMTGCAAYELQGAASMIAAYQKAMTCIKSGGMGGFASNNVTTDGKDPLTASGFTVLTQSPAYQGVRHAWAACMVLGNARFNCYGSVSDANTPLHFDWFWTNATTGVACTYPSVSAGKYFLGTATDAPQTSAYQNGMYRRRFQYGEVWWNPRDNGARTISFGATVRFITSAQDPTYTGGSGTSRAIADRDGLVVLY